MPGTAAFIGKRRCDSTINGINEIHSVIKVNLAVSKQDTPPGLLPTPQKLENLVHYWCGNASVLIVIHL